MSVIRASFTGFDYQNESYIAEIKKNIETLLSTPAGTVPMERELGLSTEYVDAPMDVAENMLAVEIVEKVAEYEPRVDVLNLSTSHDGDGNLTFTVLIGPNDEYDEDDEEDDEAFVDEDEYDEDDYYEDENYTEDDLE